MTCGRDDRFYGYLTGSLKFACRNCDGVRAGSHKFDCRNCDGVRTGSQKFDCHSHDGMQGSVCSVTEVII